MYLRNFIFENIQDIVPSLPFDGDSELKFIVKAVIIHYILFQISYFRYYSFKTLYNNKKPMDLSCVIVQEQHAY